MDSKDGASKDGASKDGATNEGATNEGASHGRTSDRDGGEAARALACLDRILAAAPRSDQHEFTGCTQALVRLRDRMIDGRADATSLEHVNAVISVVMAGHFPLGPIPWDELRRARGWLAEIALRQG